MPTYINFGSQPQQVQVEHRFDYEASSNPLVTTNPPQVGDSWVNTTTGEIFVCIDATSDDNVWKGTQGSTIRGFVIYGESYAIGIGGMIGNPVGTDNIQRFSFISEGNAVNINNLSAATLIPWVGKNETHAIVGNVGNSYNTRTVTVEKIQLSNPDIVVSSAPNLINEMSTGAGLNNGEYIYQLGGLSYQPVFNEIRKYATTADGDTISVSATLSAPDIYDPADSSGASFKYHGLKLGGYTNGVIDKFLYTNETIQAYVSTIPDSGIWNSGQSAVSETHGYRWGSLQDTNCYKVSADSDSVSSLLHSLGNYGRSSAGITTTSGYKMGGGGPSAQSDPNRHNQIFKMVFSNDTTATDVGDLTSNQNNTGVVSH
jgi:hypothetical protein